MRLWNFFALFLAVAAIPAVQAVELTAASNQQLVNEMARRLGVVNPGPAGGDAVLAASGSGYEITLTLYMANGQSTSLSLTINNSSSVQKYISEIGQRNVSGLRLVGICNGYDLHTLSASVTNGIHDNIKTLSSSSDCMKQADALNAAP